MISHKDLNHWAWDEVVKTVTSTTYRQLEKWWNFVQW